MVDGEEGVAITDTVSFSFTIKCLTKVSFSEIARADVIFSPQIVFHRGHVYGVNILVYVS